MYENYMKAFQYSCVRTKQTYCTSVAVSDLFVTPFHMNYEAMWRLIIMEIFIVEIVYSKKVAESKNSWALNIPSYSVTITKVTK